MIWLIILINRKLIVQPTHTVMTNFKNILLVIFLSVIVIYTLEAQAKVVLTEAIVDNFINTVKPMNEELKELGYDLTNEEGLVATVKVQAVMKKYGWDESFAQQFAAITLGFSYLQMMENIDKMPQEQQQAMKDMYTNQYKSLVHDDDLKLIKPKLKEIEAAFKD